MKVSKSFKPLVRHWEKNPSAPENFYESIEESIESIDEEIEETVNEEETIVEDLKPIEPEDPYAKILKDLK